MKAKVYIDSNWIGTVQLEVLDASIGVLGGQLEPVLHYEYYKVLIQNYAPLSIQIQLEHGPFLVAVGGVLIHDLKELPEEVYIELGGVFNYLIEDNFKMNPPKERLFVPWEWVDIYEKIAQEKKLRKLLEQDKEHSLSTYQYQVIAKYGPTIVLLAIYKREASSYSHAVVNWNNSSVDFYEDFDHFLYYRMYPDKREWEY